MVWFGVRGEFNVYNQPIDKYLINIYQMLNFNAELILETELKGTWEFIYTFLKMW